MEPILSGEQKQFDPVDQKLEMGYVRDGSGPCEKACFLPPEVQIQNSWLRSGAVTRELRQPILRSGCCVASRLRSTWG